ncbi:hypothetical protein LINGRAPRIM_LOCUS504 [Linum grandiflorum]
MDSAASHHVTSDLGNLSLFSDYNGPTEIVIGDGTSLHITHIGSSLIILDFGSFFHTFHTTIPCV